MIHKKMYILKHCETNEYIASKFRGYGKYEIISLNKLKENNFFFKDNEKIKKLFSKNYHVHFRGRNIDLKLHEVLENEMNMSNKSSQDKLASALNLHSIDP